MNNNNKLTTFVFYCCHRLLLRCYGGVLQVVPQWQSVCSYRRWSNTAEDNRWVWSTDWRSYQTVGWKPVRINDCSLWRFSSGVNLGELARENSKLCISICHFFVPDLFKHFRPTRVPFVPNTAEDSGILAAETANSQSMPYTSWIWCFPLSVTSLT